MDVIKQTHENSCLHCVLAMIVGETEPYVLDWFKNYGDGVTLTILDACIFLAHHGIFMCSNIDNVDKSIIGAEFVSIVVVDGTPLLVAVDSEDYPGLGHIIYWDGEKIFDPNPNTTRTKLSEYEVFHMYPLTLTDQRIINQGGFKN